LYVCKSVDCEQVRCCLFFEEIGNDIVLNVDIVFIDGIYVLGD